MRTEHQRAAQRRLRARQAARARAARILGREPVLAPLPFWVTRREYDEARARAGRAGLDDCERKDRYPDPASAGWARQRMELQDRTGTKELVTYRCPWCDALHLGHAVTDATRRWIGSEAARWRRFLAENPRVSDDDLPDAEQYHPNETWYLTDDGELHRLYLRLGQDLPNAAVCGRLWPPTAPVIAGVDLWRFEQDHAVCVDCAAGEPANDGYSGG